MNRREFARLLAVSGAAPFFTPELAWPQSASTLPPATAHPDERFWLQVRERFMLPADLAMINAANLCPSSAPVLDTLYRFTKDVDQDPSFDNRVKLGEGRETTRKLIAEFLQIRPPPGATTLTSTAPYHPVPGGFYLPASPAAL